MTISCGLCWNIDSRKIIWPPRAHFGSENESLKGLSIDNNLGNHQNIKSSISFCKLAKKLMLFFELCNFASDVFVSKNHPKGHGI